MTYINLEARVVYCGTLYVGTSSLKLEGSLLVVLRSSVRLYKVICQNLTGVVDCGCKAYLFGGPSFPQKRGPSTGQMTHPLLWLPTYRRRRVKDWHRTSKARFKIWFSYICMWCQCI